MKKVIFYAGIMFLLAGCGGKTWLVQPEFNPVNVKRVAVVVPSATVKMIDVTNDITVDQDLSSAAKPSVEKGTVDALKERGFEAFLLTNKEDEISFLKGFRLLAGEIDHHFPGRGVPTKPSQIEGFKQILKDSSVDCIVAVEGVDHKSTPGRKAKMAALALLGVSGGHGLTTVSYNIFCGQDGKPAFSERISKSSSINDPADVADMVGKLVDHMKEVKPTL